MFEEIPWIVVFINVQVELVDQNVYRDYMACMKKPLVWCIILIVQVELVDQFVDAGHLYRL